MGRIESSSEDFPARLRALLESSEIGVLILDLDDTLIVEADYLYHAYQRIAMLALRLDIGPAKAEANRLMVELKSGRREGLLDRLAARHGRRPSEVAGWLEIMRSTQVPGGLEVAPWAQNILSSHDLPGWIVTNGNPDQQRAKFAQMTPNWVQRRLHFVAAAEWGAKPRPDSLIFVLNSCGAAPSQALMIGDSDSDEEAATRAGVRFLRAPSLRGRHRTASKSLESTSNPTQARGMNSNLD